MLLSVILWPNSYAWWVVCSGVAALFLHSKSLFKCNVTFVYIFTALCIRNQLQLFSLADLFNAWLIGR